MIINEKATVVDGRVIHGVRFVPAGESSAHLVLPWGDQMCGITYRSGSANPSLLFTPSYQLPPFARDKRSFQRFLWGCSDDRAIKIKLDPRDGELIYRYNDMDLSDDLEGCIDKTLDFLLGDTFHDELVAYVNSMRKAS